MSMPKDEMVEEMLVAWRTYLDALEKSLNSLEAQIDEAKEMAHVCTDEWCEATEHVIDDLSNSLFSISEPRWSSDEDSRRIKSMRRKVHDLYANYREAYRNAAAGS